MVRAFKLTTIVRDLQLNEEIKALLKIAMLTLYMVIYLHL